MVKLADAADDNGVAWPSIGTIMRETGLGERAVQIWIGRFRAVGALEPTDVFRGGRRVRSNAYRINLVACRRAWPPHPPVGARGAPSDADNGARGAPSDADNGARGAPSPRMACPQSVKNLKINAHGRAREADAATEPTTSSAGDERRSPVSAHWRECEADLRAVIGGQAFNAWLADLRPEHDDGAWLVLSSPPGMIAGHVIREYGQIIADITGRAVTVHPMGRLDAKVYRDAAAAGSRPWPAPVAWPAQLGAAREARG